MGVQQAGITASSIEAGHASSPLSSPLSCPALPLWRSGEDLIPSTRELITYVIIITIVTITIVIIIIIAEANQGRSTGKWNSF